MSLCPWCCSSVGLNTRFTCRFHAEGEVKYVREAEELIRPERNTLLVSFTDLEVFNQELATTIQEEYYRWAARGREPPRGCINQYISQTRGVLLYGSKPMSVYW